MPCAHPSPSDHSLRHCVAHSSSSPSRWQDCLDKGLNPTPSIRGALAMLFFLCVFLLLNFLVSELCM